MNWLDIILILALLVSLFEGLRMGIIRGIISLAGLIVGVILAGRYYVAFSESLTFIPSENIARIAAFAIILVAVFVVAFVIAGVLKKVVSALMMGWIDHVVGAVFGVITGGIFYGAIMAVWVNYFGASGVIEESFLAAILLNAFPLVLALLPSEFDAIRSFFQ